MATADGRVLTGLKVRQTDAELVLRDAEDREVAIPADAIEEQKPGGSLMPAGLTDAMTRAELVDLVRFLSELGKLGPYAVSPQARLGPPLAGPGPARRRPRAGPTRSTPWRPTPRLAWSPAYSKVSGELPADALPRSPRSPPPGRPGPGRGRGDHPRQGPAPPGPAPRDRRRLARRPPVRARSPRSTSTSPPAPTPSPSPCPPTPRAPASGSSCGMLPGSPARAQAVGGEVTVPAKPFFRLHSIISDSLPSCGRVGVGPVRRRPQMALGHINQNPSELNASMLGTLRYDSRGV